MLLEQPGGPLIIEQPEGDLNNEMTDYLHSAEAEQPGYFCKP
jgi:hypothetical protein